MSIEGSKPIFSMYVIAEMILLAVLKKGLLRGLNRRWLGKGLIQSSMKSLGSPSS